jgi:hypothetical protein
VGLDCLAGHRGLAHRSDCSNDYLYPDSLFETASVNFSSWRSAEKQTTVCASVVPMSLEILKWSERRFCQVLFR